MILSGFRKDPRRDAAEALYFVASEQSRRPAFYMAFGVPDTFEGRFELATLHVWLALSRLKTIADARAVAQALVDIFFSRLDDSLREMGVGDLSVGRKIRKLAEDFYGRAGAYDAALSEAGPESALSAALARNIYGSGDQLIAAPLAGYVRRAAQSLAAIGDNRVLSGLIEFPEPEAASTT